MEKLVHKRSKFEVKELDDSRIIKGYASVFGNLDADNDRIMKGSYAKTIKEWGPAAGKRIKLVAQHNMGAPIGKILVMKEDEYGLYIEAKMSEATLGNDYYLMAKEGLIDEFSVGFVAKQKDENDDGGYDIKEIKLYEVSMVTVAANEQAVVTDVKSAMKEVENLVGKVKDEDLAHNFEYKLMKLNELLNESATEAESNDVDVKEDSLEPELEQNKELETLLNLKKLF